MNPAQRPVLGHGGSWSCSRSNANFGCYQVTLWWSAWFFFCWEICLIPQSNRNTDRQNNFPSNKVCNKKFYKVTQCKILFQTFCTSIPRSFPVNLINLPFRSEEGEGQSQSITFSNKLYLQLIFSTIHQKLHHLGRMKSCFQNKLQKIFFFCCKWNKVKLQPPTGLHAGVYLRISRSRSFTLLIHGTLIPSPYSGLFSQVLNFLPHR